MSRYFQNRMALTAILCMLLAGSAQSQERAHIKLRNHTTLKNIAVFGFDSTGVFIRGADGKRLQKLHYAGVKWVRFAGKKIARDVEIQEPGPLYHQFAIGMLFGERDQQFSVNIVNGCRFNDRLHAGVGLGYSKYDEMAILPVFAEIKGYIIDGNFIPYYFAHAGYGFKVEEYSEPSFEHYRAKGGFIWKAGVGYQLRVSSRFVTLSIAYQNQNSQQRYSFGDIIDVEEQRSYRRIETKIGVLF